MTLFHLNVKWSGALFSVDQGKGHVRDERALGPA